jgi:hypothetical protein
MLPKADGIETTNKIGGHALHIDGLNVSDGSAR